MKRRNYLQGMIAVLMLLGLVLSTGCASIVSRSNWPVTIDSVPPGASFLVKNRQGLVVTNGVTPTKIKLRSKGGYFVPARYTFEFAKEGYVSTIERLSGRMNGWYFGNIILGGALGMGIVDPLTGAMWRLNRQVSATLVSDSGVVPSPVNRSSVLPLVSAAKATAPEEDYVPVSTSSTSGNNATPVDTR